MAGVMSHSKTVYGLFFVKSGPVNKLFFHFMVNLKTRWVPPLYGKKDLLKKVDPVILLDLTVLLILYVGVGAPQNIVIGPLLDRESGHFSIESVLLHLIFFFQNIVSL